MKHTFVIAFATLGLAAFAQDDAVITVNASLKDGSTVKGELCNARFIGSTIFAEELKLDPALVKSLTFSGTNGASKVTLANGDTFTMTVANKNLKIKSLLGELAIPCASLRSVALSHRSKAPASVEGGAEGGLVFYCTFDDEASVTKPAVGPKGLFLQGQFTDGKVGKALTTTVYSQNAMFELPSEFFGTSGCIEFWAKILKTSPYIGSGGDPRLFTITQQSTKNTICTLDIVSNNGSGNSGFATWTFLGSMASIRGMRHLSYEDLFPGTNYRDWHHYAIVWDKDGIADLAGNPRMALLVDDRRIPDMQGHVRSAEDALSILSTPMLLSFTHDPSLDPELSTKSPFLIDEFKIWNYAKTNFDL